MCVICIKPAGQALPPKSELQKMFNQNSDGCGFVSESRHYKGLDFERFYDQLRRVPVSENCIIHFRWATHGSVSRKNCHPFYDQTTDTWFAHNGVLPIEPVGDRTDSEQAFRSILVPALHIYNIYSRGFKRAVETVIGSSRFAFLQHGQLKTFGTFYAHNGCYYSNLRHLQTRFWFAS